MRTWGELLGEAEPEADPEAETAGFLGRLGGSLGRTSRAIRQRLTGFDPLDEDSWEALEESLIGADVGMTATMELVERLRKRRDLDDVGTALAAEVEDLLGEPGTLSVNDGPSVILVVGVNGTGKTTTIGKLAHRLREHRHDVLVAAADTFRAAAGEQLEIWATRAGADYVGSSRGGDPAAVAFDAIEAAEARGRDVVIVDTAGRLHNQKGLMEELAKVRRVIAAPARRSAARDAARARCDHGPKRPPAGEAVRRGGGRDGRLPDEARRNGEGRHRAADRS